MSVNAFLPATWGTHLRDVSQGGGVNSLLAGGDEKRLPFFLGESASPGSRFEPASTLISLTRAARAGAFQPAATKKGKLHDR